MGFKRGAHRKILFRGGAHPSLQSDNYKRKGRTSSRNGGIIEIQGKLITWQMFIPADMVLFFIELDVLLVDFRQSVRKKNGTQLIESN